MIDKIFGPMPVSGTLTANDRQAIWAKTKCSASVRGRNNRPRSLTISGPEEGLTAAYAMAMRFIIKNEGAQNLPPGGQPFAGTFERWVAGQQRMMQHHTPSQHDCRRDLPDDHGRRGWPGQQQQQQQQPRPKATQSESEDALQYIHRPPEQASGNTARPARWNRKIWTPKERQDKACLTEVEARPTTSLDRDPLTVVSFGLRQQRLCEIEQVLQLGGYDMATTCMVDCRRFDRMPAALQDEENNHSGTHRYLMFDIMEHECNELQRCFQVAKEGLENERIDTLVCVCNDGHYLSVAVAQYLKETLTRSGLSVGGVYHHHRWSWGIKGCTLEPCMNCSSDPQGPVEKEDLYLRAYKIWQSL